MTYCVGVKLEEGLIFASDSRTHAGVDNYASFCKMTVFERAGDRVLVLLSSGGLAATQAVISLLRRRAEGEAPHIWSVDSMFDVANLVADAMRDIGRRDGPHLQAGGLKFNASFILGGQIAGEGMRLFRLYAEGNFIEAGSDTNFLQTGEAKYGKPILDLAVSATATLEDATKCVLVSFDSTMLSNLSVGMPIDLLCYARDSLRVTMKRRFEDGDDYFEVLTRQWVEGTRKVFRALPPLVWEGGEGAAASAAGEAPAAAGAAVELSAGSAAAADGSPAVAARSSSASANDATSEARTAAQAAPPAV
jgi:putative proteasome-type protease